MRNPFKSIRTILFITYSSIILIVVSILVLFFYSWSTDLLRYNATSTLERLGESIQEQIDYQVDQLNTVSLNVMYSNLVKERFLSYMSFYSGTNHTPSASNPLPLEGDAQSNEASAAEEQLLNKAANQQLIDQNNDAKILTEALTAILGPLRSAEQIYLYSFNGRYYGNGFDNRERNYDVADKPFIEQLLDNQQRKIISMPTEDEELSKYYSSSIGKFSLSLYRLLFDEYNMPIGAIEVKQYAHRILQGAIEFQQSNPYNGEIYIMNQNAELIYPFEGSYDEHMMNSFLPAIGETSKQSYYRSFPYTPPGSKQKMLISMHYSANTGWYTFLTVSEKHLLNPLFQFTKQLLFTAFLFITIAIVLSYFAANKITLPIFKIRRAVRNFSFEHIGSTVIAQQKMESGIIELDELHHAFQHMSIELKQSLNDLLLAESQKLQSQLNALQSQMNPHFLYNTLANIQEMAEQQMNQQIVTTIDYMSDILRYITSNTAHVPLFEELTHTEHYIEICKMRFGQRIIYHCDVDPKMMNQTIPKLMLQPLVENSIKFGTAHEPPWQIHVIGRCTADYWKIDVIDNCGGIEQNKLIELQEKLQHIDTKHSLPSLELNGMGILNIYLRLSLMYGNQKTFLIYNNKQGGLTITIGGPLQMG